MDVKLLIQRNGQSAQTISLRSAEMVIGRQKGCGVRIPSAQVSRQHCTLTYRDDLLAVEDLTSANGTFLNGRRIAKREFVRPGDLLKVGPVTMLVQYELTQTAVGRLLKGDEEEVVVSPIDDVQVLPEPDGGEAAEVELVLDPTEDVPLVMDDPLDAPTEADPLEALRAIEAKGKSSGPATPQLKKKNSDMNKTAPAFSLDDEPAPPPKPRVKLADVKAPAASLDEDEDADEPSPDASQILGHKNWQLPTGENIRDILAQIEQGKKKS